MWGNKFSGREFLTRLATSRAYFAVFRLAISQLCDHFVFSIEDAHLAIEIGADHPISLRMEITRHAHVILVFDRPQMSAFERENLDAAVASIRHGQY